MNLKIIIVGTTIFSAEVYHIIKQEEFAEVIAFTTYKDYMNKSEMEGLPIIAFEDLSSIFDLNNCTFLNTIGYSKMNTIREKIFKDISDKGYNICTYISKHATVYSNNIGQGSLIFPQSFIGPCVKIGKSNIIYNNVSITHHISIGDFNFICSGCTIGGSVVVGNNCFIGLNSTVKNNIEITSYSLIGAASNLLVSTIEGKVYVGNPAKMIDRNSIDVVI